MPKEVSSPSRWEPVVAVASRLWWFAIDTVFLCVFLVLAIMLTLATIVFPLQYVRGHPQAGLWMVFMSPLFAAFAVGAWYVLSKYPRAFWASLSLPWHLRRARSIRGVGEGTRDALLRFLHAAHRPIVRGGNRYYVREIIGEISRQRPDLLSRLHAADTLTRIQALATTQALIRKNNLCSFLRWLPFGILMGLSGNQPEPSEIYLLEQSRRQATGDRSPPGRETADVLLILEREICDLLASALSSGP